jgi:hypothetical protein
MIFAMVFFGVLEPMWLIVAVVAGIVIGVVGSML